MKVKNVWKRPIRVGRQTLDKGEVANIPQQFLIQPRIQKLRKDGKLVFPYHEPVVVPAEPPKAAVLNLSDKVGVTDRVTIEEEE